MIRSVLFDFGGVVADEGFREGLRAIALKNGLDLDRFFSRARDLIYETGYVTGRVAEHVYWDAVRKATGIKGGDGELSDEIIRRFVIRPFILKEADALRSQSLEAAVLSDQTDWLDRIDEKTHFSDRFDRVFNSFHLGKSKRDPTLFDDVAAQLGRQPSEILFIDDDPDNVARAASRGWNAIAYGDVENLRRVLGRYLAEAPGRNELRGEP